MSCRNELEAITLAPIVRGSSKTLQFEITQPSPSNPRVLQPYNLTGYNVRLGAKVSLGDAVLAIDKFTGTPAEGEIVGGDPTAGVVRFFLDSTDTDQDSDLLFDLWLEDGGGDRKALLLPSVMPFTQGVQS